MSTQTVKVERLHLGRDVVLVCELLDGYPTPRGVGPGKSQKATRLLRMRIERPQASVGVPTESPQNVVTVPAELGDSLMDALDRLLEVA
jgi:hypothetical protein